MQPLSDTQPNSPFDTQPQKTVTLQPPTEPQPISGPGCLAWSLLSVAGCAFTLMVAFLGGVGGYLNGQSALEDIAVTAQREYVNQQLATWIPQDIANGNTVLLGARIEGLASLTPAPPELAALIVTATQFAIDMQPTPTLTPTVTPTPTQTLPPAATLAPTPTAAPATVDDDAPLFDAAALFAEAQTQMSNGQLNDAVQSLDAVLAIDPNFRNAEVQQMLFDILSRQAAALLRSGEPSTLAAGIVKANEAARYGDLGNLGGEVYIAGLYLDAQSREATDILGAITVYSQIYAQAPNYLNVRNKVFSLRVEAGDRYATSLDYCAAASQYTAALGILSNPELDTKLQTAQTACSSGQAPIGGTPADGSSAPSIGTSAPAPIGQPAPLGQRDDSGG